MMSKQTITAPCPPTSDVDAWVVKTYASAAIAHDTLGMHLLSCPSCMRRAAMSWALLPDPSCATMHATPRPDLSFLSR